MAADKSLPPSGEFQQPSIAMNVLSSTVAVLTAVAPSVPLVGSAISLLAAALRQLQVLGLACIEAQRLHARLTRLSSIVAEAGSDACFVERHEPIFRALISTLEAANACLARHAASSHLSSFLFSYGFATELGVHDRDLTQRLQEFATALQSETLMAVRNLQTSKAADAVQLAPLPTRPPPPPFSMSLSLKDFSFDLPLDAQLASSDTPRGSYGIVVFGTWTAHRLPVAIKLLPSAFGGISPATALQAWLVEAEHMRRLSEGAGAPHVVSLHGIGIDEKSGSYLVVMERLQGSLRAMLDDYLQRKRTPALSTVFEWLLDTARGVAECHALRLVHSDVKAANTLLTETRSAKIGDFGSARVTRGLSATATRGGTQMMGGGGSVLWMAPELLDDPTIAPSMACDVYSWAVLMWEVLTCHLPYHDANNEPVVNTDRPSVRVDIIRGARRPDVSLVRADTPPPLLKLLERAWASEPLNRPTMEDVIVELEGFRQLVLTSSPRRAAVPCDRAATEAEEAAAKAEAAKAAAVEAAEWAAVEADAARAAASRAAEEAAAEAAKAAAAAAEKARIRAERSILRRERAERMAAAKAQLDVVRVQFEAQEQSMQASREAVARAHAASEAAAVAQLFSARTELEAQQRALAAAALATAEEEEDDNDDFDKGGSLDAALCSPRATVAAEEIAIARERERALEVASFERAAAVQREHALRVAAVQAQLETAREAFEMQQRILLASISGNAVTDSGRVGDEEASALMDGVPTDGDITETPTHTALLPATAHGALGAVPAAPTEPPRRQLLQQQGVARALLLPSGGLSPASLRGVGVGWK